MFNRSKSINASDELLKNICISVFLGSMWGILEATLGFLLHKISFGYGFCIWFPLAFYFMDCIYRKTKKAPYMLYGALIASIIKLTNLFIEVRVDKVLNPSASIILEAVSLLILYKVLEKKKKNIGVIDIAAVNLLWRMLYAIYILLMPKYYFMLSPLKDVYSFLNFMLLESSVNTAIIILYIKVRNNLPKKYFIHKKKSFSTKAVPAFILFVFAILLQWFL